MAETAVELSGWERALRAAEKVKERLSRSTRALDATGVLYAVAGGNAVAEWVGRVDDDAVRTTRDVDLLVRRDDLPAVRAALEAAGFVYHQVLNVDTFIDGPQGKPSGGVRLWFAGERIRPDDEYRLPDVEESERAAVYRVVGLETRGTLQVSGVPSGDRFDR